MMTRGQASLKSPVKGDRFDEILASIKQSNENNNAKFTQIFTQLKDIQDSQKAQLEAQSKKIANLEKENEQLRSDLRATDTRLKKCEELLEKSQTRIIENESHGAVRYGNLTKNCMFNSHIVHIVSPSCWSR